MTLEEFLNSTPIKPYFDIERLQSLLEDNDERFRRSFITYVNEALFFDSVLEGDLYNVKRPATVLEVGAGIGLLSMLVSLRGFKVIGYEPESDGFNRMERIRQILLDCWIGPEIQVTFINDFFTKDIAENSEFDFAFAINVIEHVPDPASLVQIVTSGLSSTGRARFICPNYDFPYEPHISIPTVWNKRLTKRIFRKQICSSPIENIEGFWSDLSWPSVRTLKRNLGAMRIHPDFGRRAMMSYVNRLSTDNQFVERKGSLFGLARTLLVPLLSIGSKVLPVRFLPIIDFTTKPVSQD